MGNGVLLDSSGNGYHGVIDWDSNPSALGVPGLVAGDTCILCDYSTVTASITTGFPWSGPFALGNTFSVSFWYQQISTGSNVYLSVHSSSTGENLLIQLGNGTQSIVTNWTLIGGGASTNSGAIPDDLAPHRFTLSVNASVPLVYLDGVNIPLVFTSGPWSVAETDYGIVLSSATNIAVGNPANMDELAIYDYALSAGQEAAQYAAASTSFAAYTAAVLGDGPVGYWHLNPRVQTGWYVGGIVSTTG